MSNQTIRVDFQVIETYDPKFLLVGDTSDWAYASKKPSYILITLPGSSKAHKFTFKKKGLNWFNSNNFGITCLKDDCNDQTYVDLPDGIYTICVKSFYEGIEKSRYYLKTDRFEIEFRKTIIKNDLEYDVKDKEFRDAMFQILWMLRTAKDWAAEGDFVRADRFFTEAKKLLTNYTDCKSC